ncbi:MAG TPA: hypothetical protein GXZ36_00440 [Firmicutes bacterium]|nr:hypothetical protein [Bacillota bacterium]
MRKFIFRIPVVALILIMAFSFAGCGGGGSSGGGGGGNGGDVDPLAGYWYVQKVAFPDEPLMEFPFPSEVKIGGIPADMEIILGFVEKKMYMYEKFTAVHPDTKEKVSQVLYYPDDATSYRIDGNKARYEGGTLTFTITGNSATFIQEDEDGKTTISVYKTNASAVEGAVPVTDDEDSGDPGES